MIDKVQSSYFLPSENWPYIAYVPHYRNHISLPANKSVFLASNNRILLENLFLI
jgi:hypothetical protein